MKQARAHDIKSVNVVIFTPIEVEYRAVAAMLIRTREYQDSKFQTNYLLGTLAGQDNRLRIALRLGGKEEIEAAKVVHQALACFPAKVLIMFGTAGTLKAHQLGDIIVAKAGYSYEVGRVMDDSVYSSPRVCPASPRLVALAERLQRQEDRWRAYLPDPQQQPQIYLGPIVSGNKVLHSINAPLIRQIRERYNDALAVEMEAYAFLDAARSHPNVEAIIIRGIADGLADKVQANGKGSKTVAVNNAGAFLRYFLEELEVVKVSTRKKTVRQLLSVLVLILAIGSWFTYSQRQKVDPPLLQAFQIKASETLKAPPTRTPQLTPVPPAKEGVLTSPTLQSKITEDTISHELSSAVDSLVQQQPAISNKLTELPICPKDSLRKIRLLIFQAPAQFLKKGTYFINNQAHDLAQASVLSLCVNHTYSFKITLNNIVYDTTYDVDSKTTNFRLDAY